MLPELDDFWNKNCQYCSLDAHSLKHSLAKRWVQFHTLPDSKRFPDTEKEYQEILSRYNTIAQKVFDTSHELHVVITEYSENEKPQGPGRFLLRMIPETTHWRSMKHDLYWHLHVFKMNYSGREFDSLFRLISDDKIHNIMIVGTEANSMLHPYDGGIDVILPSSRERDQLKQEHSDWLPKERKNHWDTRAS